jgi:hypothetical protein
MLGGTLTSGGNDEIALFFANGKQVISGIGWEYVKSLEKMGWPHVPDFQQELPFWQLGVRVNIPMAAHLMDKMSLEAGVRLYLYQPCIDVISYKSNNQYQIEAIVISTKSGPKSIKAKVFIDCTGDGDIAVWSGAEYEIGDPETGALQPGIRKWKDSKHSLWCNGT